MLKKSTLSEISLITSVFHVIGVPHSGDIPYMFGWPLMKINTNAAFDAGMFFDLVDYNELDLQYAAYIADMWTNFAKYG